MRRVPGEVDLREPLLALLRPLEVGEALIEGVVLLGASVELGLRLRFGTEAGALHIAVAPHVPGARFAARSDRLAFSYRTEGGRSRIPSELGLAVAEAVAARARANEGAFFSTFPGEAAGGEGPRIRRVRVGAALDPAGPPGQRFYSLSPYVGCTIGCRFCYAQSPLEGARALLGLPSLSWGSYVDARIDLPERLAEELRALPPLPIKLCPIVSDPYQPLEVRERLTRRCLEVLTEAAREGHPWPLLILTRSALVLDDLDRLARLARLAPLRVGFSLPTVDEEVRRRFEPRGASIEARLAALAHLKEAGIATFAVAQPLLPGSIEAHAEALAACVASASVEVLRGEEAAGADFDAYPEARDPAWQEQRARALREALASRGVALWEGELPPDLCSGEPSAPAIVG